MDIFSKSKLLVRAVIALLILNFIAIGIFLWRGFSHPHMPPPPRSVQEVSQILKSELNLTDQQAEQINELRKSYFEKENEVLKSLRAGRDSMNAQMFNKDTDEELVMAVAKRISENEYRMEMLRFEQARALKQLCTPDQLLKFEGLLKEIRDYFRPQGPPPRK